MNDNNFQQAPRLPGEPVVSNKQLAAALAALTEQARLDYRAATSNFTKKGVLPRPGQRVYSMTHGYVKVISISFGTEAMYVKNAMGHEVLIKFYDACWLARCDALAFAGGSIPDDAPLEEEARKALKAEKAAYHAGRYTKEARLRRACGGYGPRADEDWD